MRPFTTLAVFFLLGASPALASEVVLYAGANCTGVYRVLIDSEADLDRTEFGNAAASVLVVAGTWTFYRDDNFQSINGPEFTLAAGSGCVNMGNGPAAQFPAGLMDSVQLNQAADGPGSAIVLYDGVNLQPPYRVLTSNTPDLDAVQFDNRISSFQVLAGAWRIFRDDGFQSVNGPPVDATGTVSDIADIGFPPDLASSVMRLNVASDPPPPPPSEPPQVVEVNCPPGSATNGAACVDCAGLGLLLTRDLSRCVCPAGQQAVGSRLINGVPVELCQPQVAIETPPQAPAADCSGNEVMIGSVESGSGGGCVPCPPNSAPNAGNTQCQCVAGTIRVGDAYYGQPDCAACDYGSVYDASRGACVCPAGTVQASTDGRGMPMCVQPAAPTQTYVIDGDDAYEEARSRRFTFTTDAGYAPLSVCVVEGYADGRAMVIQYLPPVGGGHCNATVFGQRSLREGWSFEAWDITRANSPGNTCDHFITLVDRIDSQNPRSMEHVIRMHISPLPSVLPIGCVFLVHTVTLRGPAGADWRDAFR